VQIFGTDIDAHAIEVARAGIFPETIAADLSPERLAILCANLRRMGRSAPLIAADARRPPFSCRFDRVVVDAPCSGTGTLRKHPELKWRLSPAEVSRLAAQATALVEASSELVRPGGLLVVITCSLEEEENERVMERLLAKRDDFQPAPLDRLLGGATAQRVVAPGLWRAWTADDHDGFTTSVLIRDS
jgi:16S rRNA (cytosine967-C5)-methyltransferase